MTRKTKNAEIVAAIHEAIETNNHEPVEFALTLDPTIRVYGDVPERRVVVYAQEIQYLMRICPQLNIRERIARRTKGLQSSSTGEYGPLFKLYLPEEGPYMVPTRMNTVIRHDLTDALYILWHSKHLMGRFWPDMLDHTRDNNQAWFDARRAPEPTPEAAAANSDVA